MINGKEIRPCWSDLSIFISLPFIGEKSLWVLSFDGCAVVAAAAVIAASDIF